MLYLGELVRAFFLSLFFSWEAFLSFNAALEFLVFVVGPQYGLLYKKNMMMHQ